MAFGAFYFVSARRSGQLHPAVDGVWEGAGKSTLLLLGCGVTFHFTPPLHGLSASQTTRERFLPGTHESAFTPLNPLDGLFLLDATPFALGQVIIVATQDRLDILLKIFAEFAYFFLDALSYFSLRHSVFTYLSQEPFIFGRPLREVPVREPWGTPWNWAFVACLRESHKPCILI
jgi:hypothetical protein